ncbi:hypothetical protein OUZ56_033468 [Daphnia magna]|uniref:Uncharacterized protein n=1 Tax=Daphnia magna TaxID=35525 RepID=A0ABQ9ZXW5_9CRUS|nr:hypothetical protein OUZ56_033468 [Daphnia magna]
MPLSEELKKITLGRQGQRKQNGLVEKDWIGCKLGNPSHYLYVEGEEMKNLVKDERRFPKCFLELKPKWTNPATFVLSETLVKRKRLHSDESMARDTEESASAGPA